MSEDMDREGVESKQGYGKTQLVRAQCVVGWGCSSCAGWGQGFGKNLENEEDLDSDV